MARLTGDPEGVRAAVKWLQSGGVLAMPTDTFYGLSVDPSSPTAAAALFALKGRAADAALPFVAASLAQVHAFVGALNPRGARLASRFWPGALSLVCDAPSGIAPAILAGGTSVAIRVPDHALARAICEAFGRPLPATSANRSGEPPALDASALDALSDLLLVIDGGPAPGGAPSTIVDVRGAHPRLIREGAIAWSRVLGSETS